MRINYGSLNANKPGSSMKSSILSPGRKGFWQSGSSGFINLAVTSLGFAGIIASCGFVPPANGILQTWLSSLMGMAVIWTWVWYLYGGYLPLRSNVLVMMGFSVMNLLPPLYLSVRIYSQPSVDLYHLADVYPQVTLVTTVGGLSLLIGYKLIERRYPILIPTQLLERTVLKAKEPHALIIILLLFSVAWMARGVALVSGGYYWIHVNEVYLFGRWSSVIGLFARLGLIVPILIWLLVDKNPRWRLWAYLATATELIWILPSGRRESILVVLFGLILVSWWRSKQLPRGVIVGLLLGALIAMPILGEYRTTIGLFTEVNHVSIGSSINAIQEARDRFEDSSDGTLLGYVDDFITRLYDGQHLGYLLKHYREVYDWEYGKTYYTRLPFLLLPYFVYSDRPISQVPIDNWFKLVSGGSSPTTFLGEAYINFGYVGIPIMAFLIGIILGAYDTVFYRRQTDIFVVAIYLFIGSSIPRMVSGNLVTWLGDLRNAVLLVIAIHVIRRLIAGRSSGKVTLFAR